MVVSLESNEGSHAANRVIKSPLFPLIDISTIRTYYDVIVLHDWGLVLMMPTWRQASISTGLILNIRQLFSK